MSTCTCGFGTMQIRGGGRRCPEGWRKIRVTDQYSWERLYEIGIYPSGDVVCVGPNWPEDITSIDRSIVDELCDSLVWGEEW